MHGMCRASFAALSERCESSTLTEALGGGGNGPRPGALRPRRDDRSRGTAAKARGFRAWKWNSQAYLFCAALAVATLLSPPLHALTISVVSFNVQFLGNSKRRDNATLAEFLKPYDVVFIQELVAPPYRGTFPDNTPYRADPEAQAFFESMKARGFTYILSPEDTGTGPIIHLNSTSTEWWAAFYKPEHIAPASDLPHGFLAADRSDNPDYERVPFAFAFRLDGRTDFVFISTHLKPGTSRSDMRRRRHEMQAIRRWIGTHDQVEHDYVILGDMNIKNCAELSEITPSEFVSLNSRCLATNTNPRSPHPYDQVMFRQKFSGDEIDQRFGFKVLVLASSLKPFWKSTLPYPGAPYDHNAFRALYSDHNPVLFHIRVMNDDD